MEDPIQYLGRWGTARREHRAGRLETTSCRVMCSVTDGASTSARPGFLLKACGCGGGAALYLCRACRQEVRSAPSGPRAPGTAPKAHAAGGRAEVESTERCHGNRQEVATWQRAAPKGRNPRPETKVTRIHGFSIGVPSPELPNTPRHDNSLG